MIEQYIIFGILVNFPIDFCDVINNYSILIQSLLFKQNFKPNQISTIESNSSWKNLFFIKRLTFPLFQFIFYGEGNYSFNLMSLKQIFKEWKFIDISF